MSNLKRQQNQKNKQEIAMEKFFISIFLILSMVTIGCNEQTTTPDNTQLFEKRLPISSNNRVKNTIPFQRALECLNLTREQRLVIDSIIREEKNCSIECKKEFQDALKIIEEDHKAKLQKYRGLPVTDENQKEIEIINYEFSQLRRDLTKEYRLKMTECKKTTFGYIEAILRKDQLTLWNLWKSTGKIPCERTKP